MLEPQQEPQYAASSPQPATSNLQPRITGLGYSVPAAIRTNDDPIFDWLKEHPTPGNPFQGYDQRRVLSPDEDLMTIMIPAARRAMDDAGIEPTQVDILLGFASISPWPDPNDLCLLHERLGLPARTWVVPLNNEFSNLNAGLVFADALIRAGRAQTILIAVAGNWTRHVDYHTVQSISAADGAGAAVLSLSSDPTLWQVIDQCTLTDSSNFGTMFTQGTRYDINPPIGGHSHLWSNPVFHITPAGFTAFGSFGGKAAPAAVLDLLARNRIQASEITLITHQASQTLLTAWQEAIQPAQFIETIKQFANMTVANIPVTLAWSVENEPITQPNLVLFALGPDMHANAVLLQRQQP
jgi:3-oxoacyl-[acyl-carrier-protein] synthase III